MSYEKTVWSNGDTITAAKLNNIEGGLDVTSNPLVVTFREDEDGDSEAGAVPLLADHTDSEIWAAYAEGRAIYALWPDVSGPQKLNLAAAVQDVGIMFQTTFANPAASFECAILTIMGQTDKENLLFYGITTAVPLDPLAGAIPEGYISLCYRSETTDPWFVSTDYTYQDLMNLYDKMMDVYGEVAYALKKLSVYVLTASGGLLPGPVASTPNQLLHNDEAEEGHRSFTITGLASAGSTVWNYQVEIFEDGTTTCHVGTVTETLTLYYHVEGGYGHLYYDEEYHHEFSYAIKNTISRYNTHGTYAEAKAEAQRLAKILQQFGAIRVVILDRVVDPSTGEILSCHDDVYSQPQWGINFPASEAQGDVDLWMTDYTLVFFASPNSGTVA